MAWDPNHPTPILDATAESMETRMRQHISGTPKYSGALTIHELATVTGRPYRTIQNILIDKRFRDNPRLGGRFKCVGETAARKTVKGGSKAKLYAPLDHPLPAK